MNYGARVEKVRNQLKDDGLDAVFVTSLVNIRYLCGFTGSAGTLLMTADDLWFFSDGRYRTQASEQVVGARVDIYANPPELADHVKSAAGNRLGRVGIEGNSVTVSQRDQIAGYFPGSSLEITNGLVERFRRVKDDQELELIRQAAKMADEGFAYIIDQVEAGKSEREVALDLEFFMRRRGADDVSFEPIVAAAERSALPHARPSDRQIDKDRFLLFDLGCINRGYCSDLTRTVAVGSVDDRHREVYETVLRANEAAIAAAKAGVRAADVDAAARDVIARAGYPEAFSHGLGHGVGIEIHEAPTLRATSDDLLEAGEVVTIEPGAYFPGWGGVRIEDLAVVRSEGLELLSSAPKDLVVI